jgi:hypothetical protein
MMGVTSILDPEIATPMVEPIVSLLFPEMVLAETGLFMTSSEGRYRWEQLVPAIAPATL